MRRIGDDDGRLRYLRHHALAHPRHANLPELRLDGRIAFRLLVLLADLPHRHPLALVPGVMRPQPVECRDQRHHRADADQEAQHQRHRRRNHQEDVAARKLHDAVELRCCHQIHRHAHHRELGEALGEADRRLL